MFKTIRKWLQSEQRYTYFSNDPRAARHWHNPADPVQAARIEAAAARREERAEHRIYCAAQSRNNNHAHIVQHREPGSILVRYEFLARFNPFYIAK